MIQFTQGDAVTLVLNANQGGSAITLTGATFVTKFRNGTQVVEFDNSQHTADPDQTANKGKYTLALSSSDTAQISAGPNKEIVTEITIGGSVVSFRGPGLLNVLDPDPIR
jgi:hypothetical protein